VPGWGWSLLVAAVLLVDRLYFGSRLLMFNRAIWPTKPADWVGAKIMESILVVGAVALSVALYFHWV
jgi:hypothetical protein